MAYLPMETKRANLQFNIGRDEKIPVFFTSRKMRSLLAIPSITVSQTEFLNGKL